MLREISKPSQNQRQLETIAPLSGHCTAVAFPPNFTSEMSGGNAPSRKQKGSIMDCTQPTNEIHFSTECACKVATVYLPDEGFCNCFTDIRCTIFRARTKSLRAELSNKWPKNFAAAEDEIMEAIYVSDNECEYEAFKECYCHGVVTCPTWGIDQDEYSPTRNPF